MSQSLFLTVADFAIYVQVSGYLDMLVANMPALKSQEKKLAVEGLASLKERGIEVPDLTDDEMEVGAATRLMAGSALVAVWGYYEAAIKRIAAHVMESKGVALKLGDIKGPFVPAARLYFANVLNCPLHADGTDRGRLTLIEDLRNVMAHANGATADIRGRLGKKLPDFGRVAGVKVYPGCVAVSLEFVRDSLTFLHQLVSDLIGRVAPATEEPGKGGR